jgi:DnaJ-class molecular chaperone
MPSQTERRIRCPSCGGCGTIQSADNFPACSLCWGSGSVTRSSLEHEIAKEMRGTYDMQDRGRAWKRYLDAH